MSKEQKSIPAAVLKSIDDLTQAPTFELPVTIHARGVEHEVRLQCKALGKLEWAAVRDQANAEASARAEKRIESASDEGAEKVKIVNIVRDGLAADAALVMEFAVSWDFADPLTAESLMKLEDKAGGSLASIVRQYEVAVYQGRLGN